LVQDANDSNLFADNAIEDCVRSYECPSKVGIKRINLDANAKVRGGNSDRCSDFLKVAICLSSTPFFGCEHPDFSKI